MGLPAVTKIFKKATAFTIGQNDVSGVAGVLQQQPSPADASALCWSNVEALMKFELKRENLVKSKSSSRNCCRTF